MMRIFRTALVAVATLTLFSAATAIPVATASAEGFAYDLAAELMSPYCPGRTVASCPSPQATELIQWIQVQEAGGASEDEVVEMLIERFGEEILGAPPAEGITLWAYILPVAGFVSGGGIVVFVLRRMIGGSSRDDVSASSVGGEVPPARASSDDDLARLVEAELAERR